MAKEYFCEFCGVPLDIPKGRFRELHRHCDDCADLCSECSQSMIDLEEDNENWVDE